MQRLISADKLEADMYHNAFEIDTDLQKWDSGCWIRYKMFENVIEKQPIIDAEPVRHGHWIFNPKDAIEMMFTLPKCSECGAESPNGGNYCPNCGAKMDGGENETNVEC